MNDEQRERTIYLPDLDERIDQKMLEELFIQVGPIDKVSIKEPRMVDGKAMGKRSAFVEFSDVESVLFACEMLDAINLYGRKLRILPRDKTRQMQIYVAEGMNQKSFERHRGIPPQRRSEGDVQQCVVQQQHMVQQVSFLNQSAPAVYGDRPTPIHPMMIPGQSPILMPPPPQPFISPVHATNFQLQQQLSYNRLPWHKHDGPSTSTPIVTPGLMLPQPPTPPNFYQQHSSSGPSTTSAGHENGRDGNYHRSRSPHQANQRGGRQQPYPQRQQPHYHGDRGGRNDYHRSRY